MADTHAPMLLGSPVDIPPGHCPDYYQLPASIQATHTYEQWLWLGGEGKARLVQTETEPDPETFA